MAVVLLVEDDEAQRFLAAYALRAAGHDVHEAGDGPQALARARALRPEVVVCDVMMPGMTGYEVLASLRQERQFMSTPVILLTALSDRQHVRQGMTRGADDYLTKPYKPEELCEAVAAVLQRHRAHQEAFASTMSGAVEEALEDQKESLAKRYEDQLKVLINGRWVRKADAAGDVHYPRAVVLLADLLGPDDGSEPAPARAERLKQAQQAARDVLYLFGADHVLPHGNEYLGVFAGDEGTVTVPVELRAARAALTLVRPGTKAAAASVALHAGPVNLIAIHDGLHGDQGQAVVPNETTSTGSNLREIGARAGWQVAASPEVARALAGSEITLGRSAGRILGREARELLPPRSAH